MQWGQRSREVLRAWRVLGVVVIVTLSGVALAEAPVLEITGMTFVASRGKTNEVVLRAERARMRSDSDQVHMETVHTSVSSEDDHPGFEMTCERGELDLATSNFYAEGDVQGVTRNGQHFSTAWVRYDHAEDVLYTEAPVVITEGALSYRGGGFRYLVSERRFHLVGGARVVQEP